MTAAPPVDAFVERFALEPEREGPLSGTSFAVKDLFDVAGRHTGCGNPTWRNTHAAATVNAAVIPLLLRAGARLVGRTRSDELAYSLEGRNFHEGAPINPAAPELLTGGSSSGSASAVAAGEIDFSVATDTAGSVRVPAAWCGLAGIRPTHGRVPTAGLTPLAPSFDTVGWMARKPSLLRAVGAVLLGARASKRALGASALPLSSLVRDPAIDTMVEANTAAVVRRMIETLAARRSKVKELSLGVDLRTAAESLRVLQAWEAWSTHGDWIRSCQPRFGPGVAERFAMARAITADQVREATRQCDAITARLDAALPTGFILCMPTVPRPAPRRDASDAELQVRRTHVVPLTALASLSGRPQITLPIPVGADAPLGCSLLGWKGGDEVLLEIAEELAAEFCANTGRE